MTWKDIARKLTSRKFWVAIAGFVAGLLVALGKTAEHWSDILRDIDRYEDYCGQHPDYENNRAVSTINYLKSVYQKHYEHNDFLK